MPNSVASNLGGTFLFVWQHRHSWLLISSLTSTCLDSESQHSITFIIFHSTEYTHSSSIALHTKHNSYIMHSSFHHTAKPTCQCHLFGIYPLFPHTVAALEMQTLATFLQQYLQGLHYSIRSETMDL